MPTSIPQRAVTAGQRFAQTKDILLPILDHLDSRNVSAILTTSRHFLWLGHDVLGRRRTFTLEEVQAMDPQKINQGPVLDSVRTIQTTKTIQSEPRQPRSTRFSPSELESLRKKCRNLRHISSLDETPITVSAIKLWNLDLVERAIRTSEVQEVNHVEDLTSAYLDRDMRLVWKDYSIDRNVKLILCFQLRRIVRNHTHSKRTTLEASGYAWLRWVAQHVDVRSLVLNDLSRYDMSLGPSSLVLAAHALLANRKKIGIPFDTLILHYQVSSNDRQRLLNACADSCRQLVCLHHVDDGRIVFDGDDGPPTGCTLAFESAIGYRFDSPPSLSNPGPSTTMCDHPAVEIRGIRVTQLFRNVGWFVSHFPRQYLTEPMSTMPSIRAVSGYGGKR